MRYRWLEDSMQTIEFEEDVLCLYKGKEFEIPVGGNDWVADAIEMGRVELLEEDWNQDAT